MNYVWEESDIKEGRMAFFRKLDTSKVMIGKLEHPEQARRKYVIIKGASVSVPYSEAELAHMFNENGSQPDDLYR